MRDEHYIINLCDDELKQTGKRQHRFPFLRGDKAQRVNGKIVDVLQEQGVELRVDVYYEDLKLVIEFMEIQHFQPVKLFDEPITCSNVSRGEQRRIYDQRRRIRLAENRIHLIELHYNYFKHRVRSGRLLHDIESDRNQIRIRLKDFL